MIAYFIDAVCALLGAPAFLVLLIRERVRGRRFRAPTSGKSIRIAYVLTELSGGRPGGGATHKAGFCKGLLAGGHQPTVMVCQDVPGLASVVKDYHILPAPTLPNGFPLTLSVLANNVVFARQAYRILKTSGTDVVCQRHNQMNYSGALLSRLLKVPFVLEYNSPANWRAAAADRMNPVLGQLSRFIERINVAAADRIMVVSDVLKQQLVQRGIPAAKVVVNPNGADAEMFHSGVDPSPVRHRLQLEGKIVVGFAGHHNSNNTWHGTKHLAQAVRKVAAQRKDIQFLFIGDQGVVDLVTPIVEAEGTAPLVTFACSIPYPGMPGHYAACDILVSPHVHMADGSTFFGSPVKIFEYMAMGRPIVASGIGQLAELLNDRENALLTNPGDVDGIAAAILTLAADPELRRRLGAAARETCLSRCTWKHNAERFIRAYVEASQPGSPERPGSDADPSSNVVQNLRNADGK